MNTGSDIKGFQRRANINTERAFYFLDRIKNEWPKNKQDFAIQALENYLAGHGEIYVITDDDLMPTSVLLYRYIEMKHYDAYRQDTRFSRNMFRFQMGLREYIISNFLPG